MSVPPAPTLTQILSPASGRRSAITAAAITAPAVPPLSDTTLTGGQVEHDL